MSVRLGFLNLLLTVNGCMINAELNTRFNNNIFNILEIFNNIYIYIIILYSFTILINLFINIHILLVMLIKKIKLLI